MNNRHINASSIKSGTAFEVKGELREQLRCSSLLYFDNYDEACSMVRLVDRETERGYNMTVNAFESEIKKGTLKLYAEWM